MPTFGVGQAVKEVNVKKTKRICLPKKSRKDNAVRSDEPWPMML